MRQVRWGKTAFAQLPNRSDPVRFSIGNSQRESLSRSFTGWRFGTRRGVPGGRIGTGRVAGGWRF